MEKIIINKIRCKSCGDEIESTSVHEIISCKCKSVTVDGGHEYLKRCGDLEDYEELSVVEVIKENEL